MQKELIELAKTLSAKLDETLKTSKGPNPAVWKSAQKLKTVLVLLETEWPKEEPATEAKASEPAKAAKK